MSKKNLRDHLSDFYGTRHLPATTAERLVAQARRSGPMEESPMTPLMRTWRPRTLASLAACIVIVLVAATVYLRQGEPLQESRPSMAMPQLVVAKIHADWCARSPVVAPIFAELTAEYGNELILFVTLDITDDVRRQQAHYLATDLGINTVFDAPFESGMVKLIDRSRGEVLAILTDERQRLELEGALAQALPPDREPTH